MQVLREAAAHLRSWEAGGWGTNFCWAGLGLTFGYRETANLFVDVNTLTSTKQSIFMGSGGVELRW